MKRLEVIGVKGVWYARVAGYGRVAVYHQHLLNGAGDHPARAGDLYRQDSRAGDAENRARKEEQAAWAAKTKLVVITVDDISGRPWRRLAYVGLYRVRAVEFDRGVTTFQLFQKLADLHRPSEARQLA